MAAIILSRKLFVRSNANALPVSAATVKPSTRLTSFVQALLRALSSWSM